MRVLQFRHENLCTEKMIECDQECGTKFKRFMQAEHSRTICINSLLKCQNHGCDKKIKRKEFDDHNSICDFK